MTEDFTPTVIPEDKRQPLIKQLSNLESKMGERMDDYEGKRADMHWNGDNAYHHIEKAMGELAVAYTIAKYGGDDEEMLQEAADAVNHVLMALDIGPEDIPLSDKDIRTDKK